METTYSDARSRLKELLDKATQDKETVIITRRNGEDVALIAADELRSMEETLHLLRSPANAARLLAALERSRRGEGEPRSVEDLRRELGA